MKKEHLLRLALLVFLLTAFFFTWEIFNEFLIMRHQFREIARSDIPIMQMLSVIQYQSAEQRIIMEQSLGLIQAQKNAKGRAALKELSVQHEEFCKQINYELAQLQSMLDERKFAAAEVSDKESREAQEEYLRLHYLLEALRDKCKNYNSRAGEYFRAGLSGRAASARRARTNLINIFSQGNALIRSMQAEMESYVIVNVERSRGIEKSIVKKYMILFAFGMTLVAGYALFGKR